MKRRRLKRKFPQAECVYCGGPCESSDHVPPRCLFADPRKENLIEVPSCKSCNNGFSKDDEYFKTVLGILDLNETHSEIAKLQPSITRAFSKQQKRGFVKSFLGTMKIIPRYTGSGIYAGHAPAFDADEKRLLRVAERITKGLFYHERRYRLPNDFRAQCCLAANCATDLQHDVSDRGHSIRAIFRTLLSKKATTIGNDVFKYCVAFMDQFEQPNQSAWLMQFYGTVDFFCMTFEMDNAAVGNRIIVP